MKATTHLLRAVVIASVFAVGTSTTANALDDKALPTLPVPVKQMSLQQWDAFSGSLQSALASGHEGLQIGAMRLAIQYADHVNIRASVIDLMRIYRNNADDQVRRLAVVTLGSLHSPWVINYLRLNAPFESSPSVRRTIWAVIAAA